MDQCVQDVPPTALRASVLVTGERMVEVPAVAFGLASTMTATAFARSPFGGRTDHRAHPPHDPSWTEARDLGPSVPTIAVGPVEGHAAEVDAVSRPRSQHRRLGILPTREAIVRLVGAVLAEQTDEWSEGRRYLGLEVLARCRVSLVPDTNTEIGVDQLPVLTT